jgi:hypothetical protein
LNRRANFSVVDCSTAFALRLGQLRERQRWSLPRLRFVAVLTRTLNPLDSNEKPAFLLRAK